MKKYLQDDALAHLYYCIKYGKEDTFYGIGEEAAVHYGADGGFDIGAALKNDLKIYDIKKIGGAMVTQPGDICYACISSKKIAFDEKFVEYLKEKLLSKKLNVEGVKNDLLINGKKFLGDMKTTLPNGLFFYGGHISYKVNLHLIKEVCTKPMEKTPTGLSEYGISHEELEKGVKEFNLK